VKANSLRDYAYRSIPILFALGHIVCLFYGAFAISQGLSWYEIIGLTLSGGALCMFSLTSMTHEPLHKRPIDGKLFSYYYPQFVSALGLVYEGHISIHHNPRISCTEQDFISHGGLHQSLYRYVLFTVFPSKEKLIGQSDKKLFPLVQQMLEEREKYLNTHKVIFWILFFSIPFSWKAALFYMAQGIMGMLLGFSFYYFEHYGLTRKILPDGSYEPFTHRNTWDCDNIVSNFFFNQPSKTHPSSRTRHFGLPCAEELSGFSQASHGLCHDNPLHPYTASLVLGDGSESEARASHNRDVFEKKRMNIRIFYSSFSFSLLK